MRDVVLNIGYFVYCMRLFIIGKMLYKDEFNDVKMCLVVREVFICIMK